MATIHYARTDEFARKGEKYDFLDQHAHVGGVAWQILAPDRRHTWLTEGMQAEFDTFLPTGTKETKAGNDNAIFVNYGCGVATCRDAWTYNFDRIQIERNMKRMIEVYNEHVMRWHHLTSRPPVDEFVTSDSRRISWGRDLEKDLQRGNYAQFAEIKIRQAIYRPFTKQYLFFDRILNEEVYQLPQFIPLPTVESENRLICISDKGHRENFSTFISNVIPDFHILATKDRFQCFPFYTYDEDGSNRRENITDWALAQFQARYADVESTIQTQKSQIDKWDIFHYVYALLHHPDYRSRYAANLRRELPRIPFVQDFWGSVAAGRRLAEIHVGCEQQPEYSLRWIENQDKPLNWRVERMRLSRDRRTLVYNDFLTLDGIPPEVFDYRLGNRSALEWVIDQYAVSVDKRSGIANDPNNPDDPQYIVRLIGQVITVSVETVQIVNRLPPLQIA